MVGPVARILAVMVSTDDARERRDPWFEGLLGLAWGFTAALLVCGSGAVMMIALGTHLWIRMRPDATRITTYDPSTVGSIAFVPILAGLILGGLYLRRLRRYAADARSSR